MIRNYFTRPGKNRPIVFEFILVKVDSTLPFNCLLRLCLALKWLNPGLRAFNFPFWVIANRLVKDLFVFWLINVLIIF